ncbi:MAG: protein-disulfide reductase DsbD family protein [Candidatus Krumholzibacteriia bacterium]
MITKSATKPLLLLAALALGIAAGPAAALELDLIGEPVALESYRSLSSVPQGGTIDLAVALQLKGHWHVNAHRVNDEFLIPTRVTVEAPPGVSVDGIVYPEAVEKKLSFSEKPLALYEKQALIGVRLSVSPEVATGEMTVTATVTYQACDNEKCLAPENKIVAIAVPVSGPTEAIDATHTDIFGRIDFSSIAAAGPATGDSGRLGAVVGSQGLLVAFLLVFVWGLALNLTPCVYPIIPITVGYFGGQAGGKTSSTLMLAVLYVLGMATTYSTLGLVAALTGSILGTALQNPYVVLFVALVMVGLAMSMFGAYEFRVPARLSNLAGSSSSKQGVVGAFLMGLTVGVVAAPCIGPFVLALLTFVGESGNPVLGFWLFFTLALGLGAPFIVLAVLSGNITRLPKSGEWMEWVKKLFGVILVGMAIFFLQPLIGDPVYWALTGLLLMSGGIVLGFLKKTQTTALFFVVFKRFVGIAAPLFGLYLILNPGHIIARGDATGGIQWDAFDARMLEQARLDNRFVLIDFAADWCLPCKELDHKTFSQPEVVAATSGFLVLKADLTQSASRQVSDLRKEFAIRGVPTVVFMDRSGKERKDLRVLGFVDKTEFLRRIDALKSDSS